MIQPITGRFCKCLTNFSENQTWTVWRQGKNSLKMRNSAYWIQLLVFLLHKQETCTIVDFQYKCISFTNNLLAILKVALSFCNLVVFFTWDYSHQAPPPQAPNHKNSSEANSQYDSSLQQSSMWIWIWMELESDIVKWYCIFLYFLR